VDYTLGFASRVTPLGFDLDYDISVGYFDLYQIGVGRGDVLDPILVVSHTFDIGCGNTLTPSLKVEDIIALPQRKDRWQCSAGLTHTVDLGSYVGVDGLKFTQTALWLYDNGALGMDDNGVLGSWKGGLSMPLDRDGSIVVSIAYKKIWTAPDMRDRTDSHGAEIALTFNF
jgi:hypothetical protein